VEIALIIHELLVEGGGERQCVCLAQALAQRGHRVTLYTSVYDRFHCFPEIARTFTIREVGRGALPWLRTPPFLRGYLDMRRLASVIDQRHAVWNPHHWPAQWGAVWLEKKLGGSVVWMCNDVPDFLAKAKERPSLKCKILAPLYWLYYLCDRRQNRRIALTLLLSNWAEHEYKAIYQGPTRVVRSGSDPARFAPGGERAKIRHRFGYKEDEFVLLWLGIFMPHRRLEDVIEAIHSLGSRGTQKIKLLLAGSNRSYPEYCRSLKALAKALGVEDKVSFEGHVQDEEIRDFYAAADAFVFPNERQTWGLAVLEAMSCGCPVLVSTGAGVQEILTDNVNAILFPPRRPDILANKIESLVVQPRLRSEIAQRGMGLARSQYNWDGFARQIEDLCAEVVSGNSGDAASLAMEREVAKTG
jgi:glycosyltransferase involved in cell wall biosynthesis